MDKLTKEQAIVITGFTGVCCCNFGDFHADVEKRLGESISTIGLGLRAKKVKELYREDFLRLTPKAEVKR